MKLKGDISLNVRRYGLEGTHILLVKMTTQITGICEILFLNSSSILLLTKRAE